MIIRAIHLKHFGRFGERSFEFRRGLNLIAGPNESGKSTLMEAIPAVLFGSRNKERLRPWGRQGSCEAALVLESGNRTVRIVRDILGDQVSLTEMDDLHQTLYQFEGKAAPLGRSSERTEFLAQLGRLTGITEEDVFRSSLFFGQGSLEFAGGGLAAKLKALLSGFPEVDYDRVLASLSEDYFAITRENPWGKDKTRDRQLEEVRQRLGALAAKRQAAGEALAELDRLRQAMADLEAAIETDREEYAKGEKYLAWVRKQWQLEEKEQTLRRDFKRVSRQSEKIETLQKEKEEIVRELAKTGLPPVIPADLPVILSEAEAVRKEMVGLQQEAAELRETLLRQKPAPWRPALGATLALAGLGGAVAWWRPSLTFVVLGAAAAAVVPVWFFFLWRFGKVRAEAARLKGRGQVLEQRREEAQARLAALDERFTAVGLSPSAVEVVRMQKNLARHQQLLARLREVESGLRVLESSEEVGEEKTQITRELAVLDERMERERPQRPNLLPPEELPEAEEKLAALGETIKAREKELLELARREAALQGELGDLALIEEEAEGLKAREEILERRRRALAAGIDLLAGAVEEFRRTYLERFAADIGRHLGAVTRGRYGEVQLAEDFSLSLKGKGEAWHPLDLFSRGTADGACLAARLALTRHLAQGRHLPLLLDDPLVNLDRFRLAETLKALERLSAEHQVLLFTHDENLLKRAARDRWHVLSLEENRTAPPAPERSDDGGQLHLL